MKKYNLLIAFVVLLGFTKSWGQHIELKGSYLQGIHYTSEWDLYKGGAEFSANYLHSIRSLRVNAGLNIRTVQWGSQISFATGITKPITNNIELGVELQNGIALFYKNPLYTVGLGIKGNYLLIKKEKISLGVSLELRYTNCPGYKNYSLIYSLWEVPVGLFLRF